MKRRIALVALVAAAGLWPAGNLFGCGEKFLVQGRGTRYQRPKNARAASVLIYSNPSTGLEGDLQKAHAEAVMKREGHRFTTVRTPEQLAAILVSDRFDVVLAASEDASAVEALLAGRPDAPIVLPLCRKDQERPAPGKTVACALKAPPKEYSLLEAIDKAVERHDVNARKVLVRS